MSEKSEEQGREPLNSQETEKLTWQEKVGLSLKTPIGLFSISLTTICFLVTLIGLLAHVTGIVQNIYAEIVTFLVFPSGFLFGLILLPLSAYFRRKKWFKDSLTKKNVVIDFSNKTHRKTIILFLVLSVVNIIFFSLVAYESYHFAESDYFCGVVCHSVMEPEYTAYQRSPHARVGCVSCHIGSGAEWYVKAKLSGLRQVKAVLDGDYNRPIPAPVEHLRPAKETCEECHWPEKFHGKKVERYVSFSNDDQKEPWVDEVALHIGGRNPITEEYEGIHWHVSNNITVEYEYMDEKRLDINRVRVTRPTSVTEEFFLDDPGEEGYEEGQWRTMDCIDCHNRPTHVYDDLVEAIDFGLQSKKINPDIPGIREDSFSVLQEEYTSRKEAERKIIGLLLSLQAERHGDDFVAENEKAIIASGGYLLETYMGNIWPRMNITWGTYKEHIGHRYEDEGYGCFRCHDETHETKYGKTISQSCDLCHDYPE